MNIDIRIRPLAADLWREVRSENEAASLHLDLAESEGSPRHLRSAIECLDTASVLLATLLVIAEADLESPEGGER